jgi:D-sedoheptulose 7-phosphate isomerase
MKEFKLKRKIHLEQAKALKSINTELGTILSDNLQGALPAITLTAQSSLITAFMNDSKPVLVFAQQVNGYGKEGDCFLGISTSGNSKNVLYAAVTAKAKGLKVIGLTGHKESKLSELADVCIRVPEIETYKIQELHLPVYHCICMMLEDHFFGS